MYCALSYAIIKILLSKSALSELHVQLPSKPLILCDNLSAKYLAQNPILHARIKHIERDHRFLRYHVMKGVLHDAHVTS